LNRARLAGYSPKHSPSPNGGEFQLTRFRSLLFLLATLIVAVLSPKLFGKGSPCDILIQSTTDVYGELAPCG